MNFFRLLLCSACISTQYQATAFLSTDLHRAFWADYNQFDHKYNIAYSWYQKLLSKPNASHYMYKGLLHLFAQTKQYPKILALINTLDDTFIHDVEIQLIFAQTLQYAGNQTAADQKILQLASIVKDNQQVAFNAAQIFIRRKEPENALLTIHDYISSQFGDPRNFIFHFLAAQIYLTQNKKELALKQISTCLALQPQFDKAWLMLALLHEQLNNISKAIDAYETYIQITKNAPEHITQHVATLKNSPFDAITSFIKQGNHTHALELLNNRLRTHPDDTRALGLKIEILTTLQLHDQALELALSLVEKNPYDNLWFNILHTLTQEQRKESMIIEKLNILQTAHPDSPYLSLYLGIFHEKAYDIIEAWAHYEAAFKKTHDNLIKATILTEWAALLRKYKLYPFMPELIDLATSFNHELPALYNTVAYWYATKGNNHTKAFDILKKVLPQEQNNPHLIDTLGKLFYKQQHFDLAAALFRRGLNLHPEHPDIARHLAKSYSKQWEQYSLHNTVLTLFNQKKPVVFNVIS